MTNLLTWPTTAEAALTTGLTQRHIRRLCNTGALVCVQRGKTWFVEPESLRQYEVARKSKPELKEKQAARARPA